jgi:hypothetical protein
MSSGHEPIVHTDNHGGLGIGICGARRDNTLTDRQRAFVNACCADSGLKGRTTRAAAGYAWPDKQGSRLKTYPEIAAVIRAEHERWLREWNSRSNERAREAARRRREQQKERERLQPRTARERGWYWPRGKPKPWWR